eukprot:6182310-Pleurochrysis_carterae.AAC.1
MSAAKELGQDWLRQHGRTLLYPQDGRTATLRISDSAVVGLSTQQYGSQFCSRVFCTKVDQPVSATTGPLKVLKAHVTASEIGEKRCWTLDCRVVCSLLQPRPFARGRTLHAGASSGSAARSVAAALAVLLEFHSLNWNSSEVST